MKWSKLLMVTLIVNKIYNHFIFEVYEMIGFKYDVFH